MAYTKTNWTETTPRSLANLNKIETQYDEAVAAGIDLRKDATEEFRLEVRSSFPAGPATGRMFYHSTYKRAYYYNGSDWVALPGIRGETQYNLSDGEDKWVTGYGTGTRTLTKESTYLKILLGGGESEGTWVLDDPIDFSPYSLLLIDWNNVGTQPNWSWHVKVSTSKTGRHSHSADRTLTFSGSAGIPTRVMSLNVAGLGSTLRYLRFHCYSASGTSANNELRIYRVALFTSNQMEVIWGETV